MLWIARALSGSGEIPSLEKTNPKKDREDVELTLGLVQGQVHVSKFLENSSQCFVMISLRLSIDNDIITDVECTCDVAELFTDHVLKNFTR